MIFVDYFICFMIYSFLGYICEVIYVSIGRRKFTNRGFLYSPVCPIYGFGAIIILISLNRLYNYWYLVFILGILLTSLLEYITSFIMEAIFHLRWWDYSNKKYNINGRVCLLNSILFGILVLIVIYIINPFITNSIINNINGNITKFILFMLLFIGFLLDFILSTINHINMYKLVNSLMDIYNSNEEINDVIIKRLRRINNCYPSLKIKMDKMKISFKEFVNKVKKII